MGLTWLISLIKPLNLVNTWCGEDQRANILKTHVSSNINDYSTLNNEQNLDDLYIQLKNQQTYNSDNHNHINGGPIFNPVSTYVSS